MNTILSRLLKMWMSPPSDRSLKMHRRFKPSLETLEDRVVLNSGPMVQVDHSATAQKITIIGTDQADEVTVTDMTVEDKRVIQITTKTGDCPTQEHTFMVGKDEGYLVCFRGKAGDDVFHNNTKNIVSIAFGDDGDDKLTGGATSDSLYGGAGKNILEGGEGADFYDPGAKSKITDKDKFNFHSDWIVMNGSKRRDIAQGDSCSCWFHSALAGIVQSKPNYFKGSTPWDNKPFFEYKGEGKFLVRLFNSETNSGVEVTVHFDFWQGSDAGPPGNQGKFNNLWPLLLQRAYLQLKELPIKCSPPGEHPPERTEAEALRALTGKPGVTTKLADDNSENKEDSLEALQKALKEKKPVIAGVRGTGEPDFKPSSPHLASMHCYQVNKIRKGKNGEIMVELFNPWGVDSFNADEEGGVQVYKKNDGIVVISWEDFCKSMLNYTIGGF